MRSLVRTSVQQIKPYQPGKSIELLQRELGVVLDVCKLASNENPLGPSPRALAAMRDALLKSQLYPDDSCYELRRRLAASANVLIGNVRIGNGSSELIYLLGIAQLAPADNWVMSQYSFNQPRIVTEILGSRAKVVPLKSFVHDIDGLLSAIDGNTKAVYLDLPMNPVGTSLSREQFEHLIARIPQDVLLICDEAYREFVSPERALETVCLVREGRNVITLRTFSKLHGLAGVRVGYCIGPENLVAALAKVGLAFAVNSVAQAGALAALDDAEHVERTLSVTAAGREYLREQIEKMELRYIPSQTNFLTINGGPQAAELVAELERQGIIVRPLAGYGLNEFVRVSIGTMDQNRRFIEALKTLRPAG